MDIIIRPRIKEDKISERISKFHGQKTSLGGTAHSHGSVKTHPLHEKFHDVSFNFSPFDLILYIPHDKLLREADLAHTTVQKHRYHSKDYTMTPFSNSLIDRFSN